MGFRNRSSQRHERVRRLKQAAKAVLLVGGVTTGVAMGLAAMAISRRRRNRFDFLGRVVVITGGSRGLGFALAEECARLGASVAICARDDRELRWAQESIERQFGTEVFTHVCDVTNNDEVAEFITAVLSRFGQIDILINNAGIITVGPVESQTLTDYQESMDIMYWGTVYPTLAVLPHMKSRGEGRIANITSFGGKVSVPHLVPYCSAKFAAVGFSEGMRAELRKHGIKVTTVCPGLMRTGSHLNAYFKGQHRKEFALFSFGATIPFVSINARRAARKIINAIRSGQPELVITPQAKAAVLFHAIFPGLTTDILGLINRVLPDADREQRARYLGKDSQTALTESFLQKAGHQAAKEFHQNPGTYEEGPGPAEQEATGRGRVPA
ncbi:MAG TPA: SDR family NAD(P)-dependent oxidoreductase [Terriglobales bacterium]|nr:SDR family NAD(P)-dependent oxidoreductase [Terriglobales bacterium]